MSLVDCLAGVTETKLLYNRGECSKIRVIRRY